MSRQRGIWNALRGHDDREYQGQKARYYHFFHGVTLRLRLNQAGRVWSSRWNAFQFQFAILRQRSPRLPPGTPLYFLDFQENCSSAPVPTERPGLIITAQRFVEARLFTFAEGATLGRVSRLFYSARDPTLRASDSLRNDDRIEYVGISRICQGCAK